MPTLLLISKVAPTAPLIEASEISAVKIGAAIKNTPEKNPVKKRPTRIIATSEAMLISIQDRKKGTERTSMLIRRPIRSIAKPDTGPLNTAPSYK